MIELNHQFTVPLPVDEAWRILTDLPTVARCLPGARLETAEGGEYRGGLSAKIGPITARYRGSASFREHDEISHRAVVEARGREEKGSGSASALITMVAKPDGGSTVVGLTTEMDISGRAAQFGRSLLAEVSSTLTEQFAGNLAELISSGDTVPSASPSSTATDGASAQHGSTAGAGRTATLNASDRAPSSSNDLDVVRTLIVPMLKKAAVPLGTALLGVAVGRLLGSGRRSKAVTASGIPVTYVLPYPGEAPLRPVR